MTHTEQFQFIRGLSLFLGGVLVKLNNQDYKMQMKFINNKLMKDDQNTHAHINSDSGRT